VLNDGRKVTIELFRQIAHEERERIEALLSQQQRTERRFQDAAQILDEIISNNEFIEFLTLPAYRYLN
jgi:malate synthase